MYSSSIWGPVRGDRRSNFVTAISYPKARMMGLSGCELISTISVYIRLFWRISGVWIDKRTDGIAYQYRPLHLWLMQNFPSKILCNFVTGGAYAPYVRTLRPLFLYATVAGPYITRKPIAWRKGKLATVVRVCTMWVKKIPPPEVIWQFSFFFRKRLRIFNRFFHTCYAFISMLDSLLNLCQ